MSEHYLMFTAGISQDSMTRLVQHLVDLQLSGATKLVIGISSPGGNVVSGITMYNALKACPMHVVMHNIGNVDSIANAVFLAGDERYANESATFMFHGVGFDWAAGIRLEEKNLLELIDTVNAEHNRISQIISAHSALTYETCMGLFKEQRTRGSSWAKESGLISDIADFKVPPGAEIRHLT